MKQRYRERFGDAYECPSDNAEQLWHIFERECRARGVMYRPDEIFAYLDAYPEAHTQLSLFDL